MQYSGNSVDEENKHYSSREGVLLINTDPN